MPNPLVSVEDLAKQNVAGGLPGSQAGNPDQNAGNAGAEKKDVAPATFDLDSKVKVDGKEYTIRELADSRKANETLTTQLNEAKVAEQAVITMMRSDADLGAKEKAVRTVLSRAGFTADQTEEYVSKLFTDAEASLSGKPEVKPGGKPAADDPLVAATARIDGLEGDLRKERLARARGLQDSAVIAVLDPTKEVGKILAGVKSRDGEQAFTEAQNLITQDIKDASLQILHQKRSETGYFEENWIPSAVAEAAKQVARKYRVVMGAGADLGATPETGPFQKIAASRKPVPAPTFKSGMSTADVQAQAQAYTEDAFMRIIAEAELEGASRA